MGLVGRPYPTAGSNFTEMKAAARGPAPMVWVWPSPPLTYATVVVKDGRAGSLPPEIHDLLDLSEMSVL